jgi:hypothetical protein
MAELSRVSDFRKLIGRVADNIRCHACALGRRALAKKLDFFAGALYLGKRERIPPRARPGLRPLRPEIIYRHVRVKSARVN